MPGTSALLALAVFIFIQSGFPHCLEIFGTRPDLVLILMCYLAKANQQRSLPWAAFGAGLLQDTFSGYPLGTNALSKALIALFIQHRHNVGVASHSKDWTKVVALASLSDGVLTLLMIRALSNYHIHPLSTTSTLAASAFYTTLASIPTALVLSRLELWTAPDFRKSMLRR